MTSLMFTPMTSRSAKTILGIDPGLGRTGWGVIQVQGMDLAPVAFGCISTPMNTPIPSRLVELEADLTALMERFHPDVIAVEQLLFTNNVSTGIMVGEARGIVLLVAQKTGKPIVEFTPTQVKLGVAGYGKADKGQVVDMVCRILKLEKAPTPDDAADALAIAICGAGTKMG